MVFETPFKMTFLDYVFWALVAVSRAMRASPIVGSRTQGSMKCFSICNSMVCNLGKLGLTKQVMNILGQKTQRLTLLLV